MKKFFFILSLLFVSCSLISCKNEETKVKTIEGREVRQCEFSTIEYNGHEYIIYHQGYGKCSTGGMVHNPDCPCGK